MVKNQTLNEIKQRINRCMMKLSDKDTESMAVSELESIARTLTPDLFPPFLAAVSDDRPSDNPSLRRHSLRLISLLWRSHPPSYLSPHVPHVLSSILRRRIRDPDSVVRSTCVDAVRSIARSYPSSVSKLVLKPLSDALFHEQDRHAQSTCALCLSVAIDEAEAGIDFDSVCERFVLRLVKLVKSNGFKAKAAAIEVIGSVVGNGGVKVETLMGAVVHCLTAFIGSEDWKERKAATEALCRVGLTEKEILGGFKNSCIASFESRRFDKVKIVRESMNRMIEVWRNIPRFDDGDDSSSPTSSSSRGECGSDRRFPASSVSSSSVQSASHKGDRKNIISVKRSPLPNASLTATTRKNNTSSKERTAHALLSSRKTNNKKSDLKLEIAVSHAPPVTDSFEATLPKSEDNGRFKFVAKGMCFENKTEEQMTMFGTGLKSASRVVPLEYSESPEIYVGTDSFNNEFPGDHKDSDLSLICGQLLQIENQQSSLLDLLQTFIGSSQKDIHSLETRVHGLEMVLNEISYDLASSGRLSDRDPELKSCCSLPGTEFFYPKVWRTDGCRSALPGNLTMANMHFTGEKHGKDYCEQQVGFHSSFVANPLAEVDPRSRGNTDGWTQNGRNKFYNNGYEIGT